MTGYWSSRKRTEPRTPRNSAGLEVGWWFSRGNGRGIWPTHRPVASGALVDRREMPEECAPDECAMCLSSSAQRPFNRRGQNRHGKHGHLRRGCSGLSARSLTSFEPPGILSLATSGSSSVVEHRLAKARVASSSLVSRSILHFSGAHEPGEEWNETIRNP